MNRDRHFVTDFKMNWRKLCAMYKVIIISHEMLASCVHIRPGEVYRQCRDVGLMTQLCSFVVICPRSKVVTVEPLTIPSFPNDNEIFWDQNLFTFCCNCFSSIIRAHIKRAGNNWIKELTCSRDWSYWKYVMGWPLMEILPVPGTRTVTSPRALLRRHSAGLDWDLWWLGGWELRWRQRIRSKNDCTTHRTLWWSSCRLGPFAAWGCPAWLSGSAADGCSSRWRSSRDTSMDCWSGVSWRSRSCCIRCHEWFPQGAAPAGLCLSTACRWNRIAAPGRASSAGESFDPRIDCNPVGGRRCRGVAWRSSACRCRTCCGGVDRSRRTRRLCVVGKLPLEASSQVVRLARKELMERDSEWLPESINDLMIERLT